MKLQFCNQPFKDWFHLAGDIEEQSFSLIVGQEVFQQIQRHMGKVLVGGRAHFRIFANTEQGTQFLEATLSPEFDDRHNVVGFIFHSADITEKSRNERALKDYFDNAAIGFYWVNGEGVITWANPAVLKMLGYREEDYLGHHISEFYADEDAVKDILSRLASGQPLQNYESDMLCRDGSMRSVSINATTLFEGDKFIHTRFFLVDITEQELANKAIKESEERFRMIANLVPLVIWTSDPEGSCNFLSVKWTDLTGKSIAEGLGDEWLRIIHPDDRINIRHSWMRSFSARAAFEAKFRFYNAAGEVRISYVSSIPRYDASGKFSGFIGVFQDISSEEQIKASLERIVIERTEDLRKKNEDLKSAERALKEKNLELEQINNQLSSFAHVASHDLQEPLRKIQTFSSRLRGTDGDNISEKGKDFLNQIQTSSDRMRTLIQNLLAYSKSVEFDEKFEFIDLNVLLNEVLSELEIKIHEKGAIVENIGLPTANVIRFQFYQLFMNLLSNAFKFSKPGKKPRVLIESDLVNGDQIPRGLGQKERQYHHIQICDDGIGFEQEFSDKIFEVFQRLHGRNQYEGTGIGLAICKKIVDNHGGIILADSRIKEGATFHIYLPTALSISPGEESSQSLPMTPLLL